MLFPLVILASMIEWTAAAPGSVCNSWDYRPYLYLSAYPPAESYCSQYYPLPAVTKTVAAFATRERVVSTSATPTAKLTASKSTKKHKHTTTTTTKHDPTATAWKRVFGMGGGGQFMSTLCSCIETPVTRTMTVAPTSTTTTTTTKPNITSPPASTTTTATTSSKSSTVPPVSTTSSSIIPSASNTSPSTSSTTTTTSPTTSTTSASSSSTIVAPSTSSTTTTTTITTPATTTTTTTTANTVSTTTTTTSAAPSATDCVAGSFQPGGSCSCTYTVQCMVSGTANGVTQDSTQPDYKTCMALCDSSFACVAVNYEENTGLCSLIDDNTNYPSYPTASDSYGVFAVLNQGSCTGTCST